MIKNNRRQFIKNTAATGLALSMAPYFRPQQAMADITTEPRYLFAVGALGGASIIDSFLPILASESSNASILNTFPESLIAQPNGSNIRAVKTLDEDNLNGYSDYFGMDTFVQNHHQNMAVMTYTGSSVNHEVGQSRSLNGGGIHRGQNLLEIFANTHGADYLLPNCNLAEGGFSFPGSDPDLPQAAQTVTIPNPLLFALGTDGYRGIQNAPTIEKLDAARELRASLENISPKLQPYEDRNLFDALRSKRQIGKTLENNSLIEKLLLMPHTPGVFPIADYGLEASESTTAISQAFNYLVTDPFEAQAGLAFALAREKIACALCISPSGALQVDERGLVGPPLAFDFAHTNHRLGQNVMWRRVLYVVDKLIGMLKDEPLPGTDNGKSMWDRSLIYIATEFGRDKTRPADAQIFPTGHQQNNGAVLISPMLEGNRVYGGVDPNTGFTYGFDPQTGAPDPNTEMTESDIYSGICHILDVPFTRRRDFPCLLPHS